MEKNGEEGSGKRRLEEGSRKMSEGGGREVGRKEERDIKVD